MSAALADAPLDAHHRGPRCAYCAIIELVEWNGRQHRDPLRRLLLGVNRSLSFSASHVDSCTSRLLHLRTWPVINGHVALLAAALTATERTLCPSPSSLGTYLADCFLRSFLRLVDDYMLIFFCSGRRKNIVASSVGSSRILFQPPSSLWNTMAEHYAVESSIGSLRDGIPLAHRAATRYGDAPTAKQ